MVDNAGHMFRLLCSTIAADRNNVYTPRYYIQNIQAASSDPLKERIDDFYKNWNEIYKPAIEQIKKDYGWYEDLPYDKKNNIATRAEWYEYTAKLGLEKTILTLYLKDTLARKLSAIDSYEQELKDFIAANAKPLHR